MKGDVSAFPVPGEYCDSGVTKREYFALHTLQGLLASGEVKYVQRTDLYALAVEHADNLLEELSK